VAQDPVFLKPAHVTHFPDGRLEEMRFRPDQLMVSEIGEQGELDLSSFAETLKQVVGCDSYLLLHGWRSL
jgi:hypothetical protein